MPWVALVTLASLLVYSGTIVAVGQARGRYGIVAPATAGHPVFERLMRVQENTLEWLPIYLPALWLCGLYVDARVASVLGVVWIAGRVVYAIAYAKDPAKRGAGFIVQGLATVALLLSAVGGVVWRLANG